jgi:hypothetical protein
MYADSGLPSRAAELTDPVHRLIQPFPRLAGSECAVLVVRQQTREAVRPGAGKIAGRRCGNSAHTPWRTLPGRGRDSSLPLMGGTRA